MTTATRTAVSVATKDLKATGVGRSPGDLPNPGIKPRSPALQADSLPVEPSGEPKNTEVGSLSLP